MTALIDRQAKLEGTPGGSLYIKPSQMDWKPTRFEKITIKVLYEDAGKGEMTCLLKLEPGAHVPFHKHPEIEQSFVLEGSVDVDNYYWWRLLTGEGEEGWAVEVAGWYAKQ